MRIKIITLFLALCVVSLTGRAEKPFFSTARPASIIEVEAHAIVGATAVTENYSSQIAGIDKADAHAGLGVGFGAKASFVFREYLALTTGLDFVFGHNNCAMTAVNDGTENVNNIYLSNRYFYSRIPVLMSLRFNVADKAQWLVEAGVYFAMGLSGRQKADTYTTGINDIGQLVTEHHRASWDYYRSDEGLIHSVHTLDFGLQLGTGFCFRDHYVVGVSVSYGLKDAAKSFGPLDDVSVHNLDCLCTLGYRF